MEAFPHTIMGAIIAGGNNNSVLFEVNTQA